ncbi:glycosyltransferase [Lactonifactor longoviformis]|uniref:glycosyltransferase n=1 Tax=Lactonifactor longoviformis TaxID=341220 RepID=UPI0036F40840
MKRILYVSRAGLPIDATGLRIEQIGAIYEALGYHIHYICNRRIDDTIRNAGYEVVPTKTLLEKLNKNEYHFSIENKIYSYLPEFQGGKINALSEIIEIVCASKAYHRIVNYCEKDKPDAIILYNDVYALTKKLIKYCKRKNIRLLADVTEWYEKRKNATVAEKLVICLSNYRIKKLDQHLDGVIAISHYFEQYYKQKKVNCVWVPPLMRTDFTVAPLKYNYNERKGVINFIYAGSPGSKDILLPFVLALMEVNKTGICCRLDIAGIADSYFEKIGMHELRSYGIYAHGRLTHDETLEYVKRADFGILLRKNQRYARAGFSTKFAECMSMGVPMICNKVGGTDNLIDSWENGILIDDYKAETLVELLLKICELDLSEVIKMKVNAQQDAVKYFSEKVYRKQLYKLLRGDSEIE